MARRIGRPGGTPERPAVFFRGPEELRAWFEAHRDTATELWAGIHKAASGLGGLTWAEAVLEALCFGWIDSVSQAIDEDSRRQRLTPRRPGSRWSNVNVAHVERLIAEGRMTPAGLAAYEARSPERTGTYAHEQGEVALAADQAERLAADPRAAAFWAAATPGYRKAAAVWVTSAKRPETRERRLAALIDDSAHGRLIAPERAGGARRWQERAAAAAQAAGSPPPDRGEPERR